MNTQSSKQTGAETRGRMSRMKPRTRILALLLALMLIAGAVLSDRIWFNKDAQLPSEPLTPKTVLESLPQQHQGEDMQTLAQLIEQGDYSAALAQVNDAITLAPQGSALHEELLMEQGCLMALLEDYVGAKQAFSQLNALYPNNAQAWLLNAQIRVQEDDARAAMVSMKKYLSLVDGSASEYSATAQICYSAGDYEGTLRYGEQALALEKETQDGELLRCMGLAALLQDRYEDAEAYFTRSLPLSLNAGEAHYNRGVSSMAQGKLDEAAEKDFTSAIDFGFAGAEVYYNRGVCRMAMKQNEQAYQDFISALELDPEDEMSYYNRAVCAIELEDWETVKADMEMVVSLNRDEERTEIAKNVLTELNQALAQAEQTAVAGADEGGANDASKEE